VAANRVPQRDKILDTLKPKKLLFLVAEDSYFYTHRLNLGIAAKTAGFEVAIATRCQQYAEKIQQAGIQVFSLKYFNRSTLNPISQLQTFKELFKIYKHYSPDIVHHVGIKPVILGTLIAQWCKTPYIVNALGGLGYLFTDSKSNLSFFETIKKLLLRKNVLLLLSWLHSKSNVSLILQNQDDINTLLHTSDIESEKISLIRGAGVDTQIFPVTLLPAAPPIIIACVARMLWDKGIGELIAAAKMIQQMNYSIHFMLYGMPDLENPTSINIEQLQAWHNTGIITWNGYCKNVAQAYTNCHIAVLPSYREGLPKSLLEAASSGRAIVTTDVPGCREIVQHGKNGLLVPSQDAKALAEALITLSLDPSLQLKMGLEGRALVETHFSDTIINQQTIALYQHKLGPNTLKS
jgi:glycosyltransferase involved in cell wall biosynthesis